MQKLKTRGLLMTSENAIKVKNRAKTITRRLSGLESINEDPDSWKFVNTYTNTAGNTRFKFIQEKEMSSVFDSLRCPSGEIGDELWIREDHMRAGYWYKNGVSDKGNQKWRFTAGEGAREENCFFPDDKHLPEFKISRDQQNPEKVQYYKRLGRFMPHHLARTKVQITGIRAERLHEITNSDAIAEGVSDELDMIDIDRMKTLDFIIPRPFLQHQFGFMALWTKIHGNKSWEDNLWVWVITFKKVS